MKHLRQNGFTLIELLLYVAIVGTLLLSVSAFFAVSTSSQVKDQVENNVNQEALFALNLMTQTIRNANSITAPAIAGTGTSLTLSVPTAAKSPTIFDVNSGSLQVKEGTGAAIALTSSDVTVSNFTVKNLGRSGTPGIVQISFTVSNNTTSSRSEVNYQKTFTTSASIRP